MRSQKRLQSTTFMRKVVREIAGMLAFALMLQAAPSFAVPFNVTIDTSTLSGQAKLAFDLTDGDGLVDNSVIITNFALSGATLGSVDPFGTSSVGITGVLPSAVTLAEDNSTSTVTLMQDLTFTGAASSIFFTFDLSANVNPTPGSLLDTLAFSLLDDNGVPLGTDLLGSVLVLVDIDGTPAGNLQLPTQTPVGVSVTQAPIPEPEALGLTLLGLGALSWSRKSRPAKMLGRHIE